ncbi:uncharacterized protein LOC142332192 [Lycorma delicatula]|uniref:uncharacterized protein LOC142332192 n=1 Tax=Lycorma delicatula TaxID=130591 RepID=UPI003F516D80
MKSFAFFVLAAVLVAVCVGLPTPRYLDPLNPYGYLPSPYFPTPFNPLNPLNPLSPLSPLSPLNPLSPYYKPYLPGFNPYLPGFNPYLPGFNPYISPLGPIAASSILPTPKLLL